VRNGIVHVAVELDGSSGDKWNCPCGRGTRGWLKLVVFLGTSQAKVFL
jgi:hypothetical protein